jgi:hypothetical protein
MEPSTSDIQVTFKTADGKLITAASGFTKFSHLVADLMQIQLQVQQNEPIDLAQIHSRVVEQVNELVQRLENEELKGQMPVGKFEDELWNEFTVSL